MKNKVIVLGALGMAGHIMTEYLKGTGDYDVLGVARQPGRLIDQVLDVTDFEALKQYLEQQKPNYLINCVGALVSYSSQDASSAILLNSYLPHFLSKTGENIGYKLVHISTDCVFSGKKGAYTEDSLKDGDDTYARSKALGEIINDRDLTIRTSIIGPELKANGTGLLDWFLKQQEPVKGYSKAFWSGVTTLELAKAADQMIRQNICGLFHLCPQNKISKYDLLKLLVGVFGKKLIVSPFDGYSADKSLVCTRRDFTYPRLEYQLMLEEMKEWMDDRSSYYLHYTS